MSGLDGHQGVGAVDGRSLGVTAGGVGVGSGVKTHGGFWTGTAFGVGAWLGVVGSCAGCVGSGTGTSAGGGAGVGSSLGRQVRERRRGLMGEGDLVLLPQRRTTMVVASRFERVGELDRRRRKKDEEGRRRRGIRGGRGGRERKGEEGFVLHTADGWPPNHTRSIVRTAVHRFTDRMSDKGRPVDSGDRAARGLGGV